MRGEEVDDAEELEHGGGGVTRVKKIKKKRICERPLDTHKTGCDMYFFHFEIEIARLAPIENFTSYS